MHELSVIQNILQVALKHAIKNGVSKISAINLEVGELSDLEDAWMQRYFEHLSKDTPAAGAILKITRIPVIAGCNACGHRFSPALQTDMEILCPVCESGNWSLVAGKNYFIRSMEAI